MPARNVEVPPGESSQPRLVHELIEAQAQKTPDAVALVFEGEQVTYRDFDADVNRLANALIQRGVKRGAVVAVCMDRSIEMLVALHGVVRAGAAYAPLDPAHPPARLELLANDLAAPVVLTTARTAGPFASSDRALIVDRAALRALPSTKPSVKVEDGDLAYVIFTSGSTGTPKGVMSTHGGMRNRLLWAQAQTPIGPADAVLQKTPYTFDVSVWELFWPLFVGARMVIAKPEGHKDPQYVGRTIRDERVTMTHFVPSMLAVFLESYEPGSTPSLRRVLSSGEALPRALADRFLERVGCELVNLYGPTEASIDVSYWTCSTNDAPGEVPIGRPVWNTQLHIVDRDGQPCPIGTPGELLIGGVQVARGYWGRAELTAERFVPDPFSPDAGARMYRTGDLARWRADGAIEYLGRIDHQVKIRGLRVELGEIEATLERHEAVARAVVLLREDRPGDQRLVAYVLYREGVVQPSPEQLRTELSKTLPDYMVPGTFVVLESLPLTTSGKVDRKALPAPETRGATSDLASAGSEIERTLAGVWSSLLRVERVVPNDNFFDLGGHSLMLAQVAIRVKKELGVELSLGELFDALTLRQMSDLIAFHLAATSPDEAEMNELLGELEGLSASEAEALLAGT